MRVLGFDLPASSADVALAKLTVMPPSNATGAVLFCAIVVDISTSRSR